MYRLCLTVTLEVTVGRLLDSLSVTQIVELLVQQLPVESIRMVEVNGMTLFVCHARCVVIVRVKRHYSHKVRRQSLNNFSHYRGFARAGSSGYTDDGYFVFIHSFNFY